MRCVRSSNLSTDCRCGFTVRSGPHRGERRASARRVPSVARPSSLSTAVSFGTYLPSSRGLLRPTLPARHYAPTVPLRGSSHRSCWSVAGDARGRRPCSTMDDWQRRCILFVGGACVRWNILDPSLDRASAFAGGWHGVRAHGAARLIGGPARPTRWRSSWPTAPSRSRGAAPACPRDIRRCCERDLPHGCAPRVATVEYDRTRAMILFAA